MATRRVYSLKKELVKKSQEAALSAIKIFNDPLIQFKSETYILLMIIAWTYLMHAYYRDKGVDYKYYRVKGKRKIYDKTKYGCYKQWELEKCIDDTKCPLDAATKQNLKFLIGLRHEIEHQMTNKLDNYLSGRYQACVLNYNKYIKEMFGSKCGIDEYLTYSLQFIKLSKEQITNTEEGTEIPHNLKAYIVEFESSISDEVLTSDKFSYKMLFTRTNVNNKGQADKVIEFVDPKSEIAESIEKQYIIRKEVEKDKYRPKEVVLEVKKMGYSKFSIYLHTQLWQKENAKQEIKGYGTSVSNQWFWYQKWIDRCVEICAEKGNLYK